MDIKKKPEFTVQELIIIRDNLKASVNSRKTNIKEMENDDYVKRYICQKKWLADEQPVLDSIEAKLREATGV